MAGKSNKDFLAKLKRTCKHIGNMAVDNVKDKPDLPRTDNINIILQNFVEYCAKLLFRSWGTPWLNRASPE
jgi:hypothetical protein